MPSKELSDELLYEILTCSKRPLRADRRKMVLDNRHFKNNVELISADNEYMYKMFLRQSDIFIEDFSVGLIWTNANSYINVSKNIILLRCQGPHDGKSPFESDTHHSYHIHMATAEDVRNRRYAKPSRKEITDEFRSFEQALLFFTAKCNIIGLENFIELPAESNQISFCE